MPTYEDPHNYNCILPTIIDSIFSHFLLSYRHIVKRCFDFAFALLLLILCVPIVLLVAWAVRLQLGRPILFQQPRAGTGGRTFVLHKFRTMTDARDDAGCLLPDDVRLTSVGKFLRANSLDELPQLWNVIRGEMSLIGPRPLLLDYLPRYNPHQARRHECRPGITGWAQVNGRNAIDWEERFDLDVFYVDHVSLWFDLNILVLTVVRVFQRHGISQSDHPSMSEFRGSPEFPAKTGSE